MRSGKVERDGDRITVACFSAPDDHIKIDVRKYNGELKQLEIQTTNAGNVGPWVFVREEQVRELLTKLLEVLDDR